MKYREYKEELLENALKRDPAFERREDVLLFSPGVKALLNHFVAHELYLEGNTIDALDLSYKSRIETGIEIHPAAIIGRRCYIDHGFATVIGATAEIGDDCLIYHSVTLGAIKGENVKRHPTVGNNVMIGAGAVLLGDIKIGNNVKIGANSVVNIDIPDNCTAVGAPARIIERKK